MSSSSTTSPSTNNRRCAPRSKPVGAQLRFLPPYSPDFNPIELAFAKLKAFIRAARPRTFDHVCDLIAIALGLFTADRMPQFRPALRLSRFYSVMKNALACGREAFSILICVMSASADRRVAEGGPVVSAIESR